MRHEMTAYRAGTGTVAVMDNNIAAHYFGGLRLRAQMMSS